MLLRNKTDYYQPIAGKTAWPWRDVEVPDGTVFDEAKFEIIKPGERKGHDLNADGKVDEKDAHLAGQTLAASKKK